MVGALHEAGKRSIGNGAISQAILHLDGRLEEGRLREVLQRISDRFPIIHGRFSRDWFNLAPYWKVPRRGGERGIGLSVVDLGVGESDRADQLLADHVNTPLEGDGEHIRFLLVRLGGERSKLGLLFDHRLFDAHGAETFFRLMDETFAGRLGEIAPQVKVSEPAHLDHWMRRFASGKTLNRHLVQLQQKQVAALAMPGSARGRRIRFVHETLSVEESAGLNQTAFAEIGLPILLPSAAARAVDAVQRALPEAPLAGGQYLLFTSANMRGAGEEWASIFFNHFSFVFFSVPIAAVGEPRKTIKEVAVLLRDQFFGHMKDKIPFAMQDAAALGRIFPRLLVARMINSMFDGRMCSFYFACLKETGYPGETFLGVRASNLTHTPLAFAPPGMNLCMTFFGGRFNLVLSYLEGAMEDATAAEILRGFKGSLVAGCAG